MVSIRVNRPLHSELVKGVLQSTVGSSPSEVFDYLVAFTLDLNVVTPLSHALGEASHHSDDLELLDLPLLKHVVFQGFKAVAGKSVVLRPSLFILEFRLHSVHPQSVDRSLEYLRDEEEGAHCLQPL